MCWIQGREKRFLPGMLNTPFKLHLIWEEAGDPNDKLIKKPSIWTEIL